MFSLHQIKDLKFFDTKKDTKILDVMQDYI